MPVIKSQNKYTRPTSVRPEINLLEFYNKRKKILIQRSCGGLGDILMHRMMFEDFKHLLPNSEIHFACPKQYHDAVIDHPFIDQVLDSNIVNHHDYIIHYNTSTACGRWEMKMAPLSGTHRSDIWANHCGVDLKYHNMHFKISLQEQQEAIEILEKHRDRNGKCVIIAPISAMHNKNLSDELMVDLANELRNKGYFPVGIHGVAIFPFLKNDIPTIYGLKLRQWLAVINQADYIISVDTSHFHAAGGLLKPVVGIFTFVNGETYSSHYPTVEFIQGPCPLYYSGCYDWGQCPKIKEGPRVPCCAGITMNSIINAFDRLVEKHG